jgi:hypothetical protein
MRNGCSSQGEAVSRRNDAAEAVHQRCRRSGEQHIEIAQALEIAVDRDAGQSG